MKAIWNGEDDEIGLRYGKVYEILNVVWDGKMFNVVDETGGDYLYPAEDFEVIEEDTFTVPEGTYIMLSEPCENMTPDDLKLWLKDNQTEFNLAMAIGISNNKWVWFLHDCNDDEKCRPICDEWWELYKELVFQGFEILKKENETGVANHDLSDVGWYYKIKSLMERNGFIDGNGWWIRDYDNEE